MLIREFFVDALRLVECPVLELRLGNQVLLECQGVKCRLVLQPLTCSKIIQERRIGGQNLHLDSASGTICIPIIK